MKAIAFYVVVVSSCTCLAVASEPWARHTIDETSRGADGVRLADVNGDGRLDIATGWEEGGKIRVYLQPDASQTKQPWPSVTVGNVKSPEDAVFVDVDGDGAIDVVSSCEGKTRTMFVHWAPAKSSDYLKADAWKTEPIPVTRDKQMWMFATPMQVDGKRGIDIVVGSKGTGATVGWLQSPPNPRSLADWKLHQIYDAGWIMSLQTIDIDGDGTLNILASDRKGANRGVVWFERLARSGNAVPTFKTHRIGGAPGEFMFLHMGDMNGDHRRDILCAQKDRPIYWYSREQSTSKWKLDEVPLPVDCGSGKGVAIADVNLDGRNDIVFSCEHATGKKSGVRWLSLDGSRWIDREISGAEGAKFDRLEMLDLDDDGDLDALTCEERTNLGVIWYENPTK